MLDCSSWGSGKSGVNPGLCRNCDGACASSQNTVLAVYRRGTLFHYFLASHGEGVTFSVC